MPELIGESASDQAGYQVTLGDFDGDALSDILVGALSNDRGASDGGAAYLFLGRPR